MRYVLEEKEGIESLQENHSQQAYKKNIQLMIFGRGLEGKMEIVAGLLWKVILKRWFLILYKHFVSLISIVVPTNI